MTKPGDLILDPFAGVGSAGVAAVANDRRFLGIELDKIYADAAKQRLNAVVDGEASYRPHNAKIPNPKKI